MKMRFKDCHELTELPYFEHDEQGRVTLSNPDEIGPIIDMHTHLAFVFLFAPPVDLNKRTPEVKHNFPMRNTKVNLEVYSGINITEERRDKVHEEYMRIAFTNRGPHATHTGPNLAAEMDLFNVERSVILAIEFPVASKNSEAYLDAASKEKRLVPYVCVNPLSPGWEARMDRHIENGARGLKVHPFCLFLPSDNPLIMKMLRRWSKSGLPVLFHTGYNGIEPSIWRNNARMETYEKPIREFPGTKFLLGHAGMDFYPIALNYMAKYPNVYLEIDGQSPANLKAIFENGDHERMLFGTDWPFYPLVMPLAKTLIATEGNKALRRKVLYENAAKLLDDTEAMACARR